jgi:NADH dehydrogenase
MRLIIVGGGFAGVWAAIAAAEARDRHNGPQAPVDITLISRDPWLTIRPRLYERSLDGVRVQLDPILRASGVERLQGDVTHIDSSARRIAVATRTGELTLHYDRLIVAAGSELRHPPIPGIDLAFSVDTFVQAEALDRHLQSARSTAVRSIVVVGAGFTGLEVATELASRHRSPTSVTGEALWRVILVDSGETIGRDLSDDARHHARRAVGELGIELRLGQPVRSIENDGVTLADGERIRAVATVWTGGLRANPIAGALSVEHDELGRIPVDEFLRVRGLPAIYAAGDVARVTVDASFAAPMSCQYAIPMGTLAGTNAVSDLFGLRLAPLSTPTYVTCLDLGDAGALFTEGFGENREVKLTGYWAKVMKETINRRLIYPPVPSAQTRTAPVHRSSAA